MGMVYQWKAGTHHKLDAQLAGEELERIRTFRNGRLEATDVVAASRPIDAPLHSAFEWNDAKAAEAWREDQASAMIRHIAVVVETLSGEPSAVRAFVSVKRDEDRSYTSVQHALADRDLRNQVLRQALSEMEAWRRRYAELIELADVFAAIDQARPAG